MNKYRLIIDFYGIRSRIFVYARNVSIAIRKAENLYPASHIQSGNIRVIHR